MLVAAAFTPAPVVSEESKDGDISSSDNNINNEGPELADAGSGKALIPKAKQYV